MDDHDRDRGRGGWAELGLVIGFLAVLCYPAVVLFGSPGGGTGAGENRVLAVRPQLSLLLSKPHRFARAFKSYFDDQFGARDRLVLLNSMLRYRILHASSNPLVIPAKHGVFFFTGDPTVPRHDMGNEMVQYRRTRPMRAAELENVCELLERRRRWAEEMGAKFLFVIAPDKSTVYADQMPERFNRLEGPSATDQILGYLRASSRVEVLDLREKLIAARREHPVYLLRDSHWNEYGAFAGYEAIANRLHPMFPEIEPLRIERMKVVEVPYPGDLAKMLNMGDQMSERRMLLLPEHPRSHTIPFPLDPTPVPSWLAPPMAARIDGSKLPRALVYHDSFMYQMMPFLSEHFQTVAYIRDFHVTVATARDFHPDLVIFECVERKLRDLIGMNDDLRPGRQMNMLAEGATSASRARN